MKALILAAGEGTRLRPLTADLPKPMLSVAGKTLLQHLINSLKRAHIKEIWILTGWREFIIKDEIGNGKKLNVNINYLTQEKRLGTAHAIGCARGVLDEEFICVNGDIVVSHEDIKGIVEKYKKKKKCIMATAEVSNPEDYGVVHVEKDSLIRIDEKAESPRSYMVNAGVYVFTPDIFDYIEKTKISPRGEYEITDTLNIISPNVEIYKIRDYWLDIGKPWDLLGAHEIFMERIRKKIAGTVEKNAVIHGKVIVEKGAVVKSGSYIEGPVIIDKGTSVGPNCYIRGKTYIGKNCHIGSAVEIKNSIIMQKSNVPHMNYIGDSIIGEGCNLGAGTKIANLRLDGKNVISIIKGKKVDTGRRKMGAIIGKGVKTGINVTIDAGTIIGENSYIGPGSCVFGSISPNSRVY